MRIKKKWINKTAKVTWFDAGMRSDITLEDMIKQGLFKNTTIGVLAYSDPKITLICHELTPEYRSGDYTVLITNNIIEVEIVDVERKRR